MWFAIDMADGTESLWFYWPMLGTGLAVAVTAIVLGGIGGIDAVFEDGYGNLLNLHQDTPAATGA
jgi:hypothetical protein